MSDTISAVEELVLQLARFGLRGVRVVFLGNANGEEGVRVSTGAPVAALAAALAPGGHTAPQTANGLTAGEREVWRLVSMGLAGKQVASELGISPKTVERHKTRIFAKLGVPNQAAAVFAYANGWKGAPEADGWRAGHGTG